MLQVSYYRKRTRQPVWVYRQSRLLCSHSDRAVRPRRPEDPRQPGLGVKGEAEPAHEVRGAGRGRSPVCRHRQEERAERAVYTQEPGRVEPVAH